MIDRQDELYHHGVKGQKWGIIRKKQLTYDQAQRKANKLIKNADKAQAKLNKVSRKRDKVIRRYRGFGFAGKKDVANISLKYYKAQKKYDKKRKKADEWMTEMDEVFRNTKISSLK